MSITDLVTMRSTHPRISDTSVLIRSSSAACVSFLFIHDVQEPSLKAAHKSVLKQTACY